MATDVRFLVIQDHKENRRKCTVSPLVDNGGIDVVRLACPRSDDKPIRLPGGIWLDVNAPQLEPADRRRLAGSARVIVLDASWARLAPLEHRLCTQPPVADRDVGRKVVRRALPSELRTAYPRRSKLYEDPARGLATIEAMFAVTLILGDPRPDLLRDYHWRAEFLRLNKEPFGRVGGRISTIHPVGSWPGERSCSTT